HRVEELAGLAQAALDRVKGDGADAEHLRGRLGETLAKLHYIAGELHTDAPEGAGPARLPAGGGSTPPASATPKPEGWQTPKAKWEAANRFPQAMWDQVKQRATHVMKDGGSYVVTMPVPGDKSKVRMARWDERGPVGHTDVDADDVDRWLGEHAYPKGDKIVRVKGGIGGTLPSASYAGAGFTVNATGAKGVRSFVGPADSLDWMTGRLASGGYKTEVEDVPRP